MNFNQGDPNNPLMQLLAGRNPFGSIGAFQPIGIQPGGQSQHASMIGANGFDPSVWEQYIEAGSEGGGGETHYRPRQSALDELNGRVQVFHQNVGGPGGVRDPSKADYNNRFGLLTDPSNINAPEDNMGLFQAILIASGAGMASSMMGAGAVGNSSGLLSAAPGQGFGTVAGAAPTGASGAAAGAAGAASGGASGGGMGLNIEYLPNITQPTMNAFGPAASANPGMLSSFLNGDIAGGLGQLGSWAISNPVQAYGAIQTIGGLLGGSGDSPGGSGSPGGNSPGGGGLLNFAAPKRPQFAPNPYLQAQLARGGYA